MHSGLHWEWPSSRLVLRAVLDVLAERGYHGLTVDAVAVRAGPAAGALDESTDLDDLVVRGSAEERKVAVLSLTDGRIDAVIALDRPGDVLAVRRVLHTPHAVTVEQLQDASVPLKQSLA